MRCRRDPWASQIGEETNEIEIGKFNTLQLPILNLGRGILASTLLAVIVTAAAGAQGAPAVSPAEARTAFSLDSHAQDQRGYTDGPVTEVDYIAVEYGHCDEYEAHMVANGASELFIQVFEERGAHARSAVSVSEIPFGCCVEIELVAETLVSESECEL